MFQKIVALIMSIIMLLTGVSFGDIFSTVIDEVDGVTPETEIIESEKEFEVSTAATSGKISTGCDYNYSYTTPEIISGDINFKNLTDGSLASTTPGGVGWTKVTLKNDTQNTSADGTPVTIALFDDSVPHFYVQLDLGFIQEVDYITMDFANDTSCARPTKVEVMLSEDGYNYDIYKAQSFTTVTSGSHTRYKVTFNEDVKAKAIKYIVYGNENDVMYIDELEVYGQKLNDTVLLSQGASYTWTGTAAGGNYNGHAPATQLTDGVLSEMAESSYSTFDNKFILKATSNNVGEDGFYGQDIVLDLGKTQNVSKTKINGLYRSNGNGGYWDMDFVVFKYSTDGVNYKNFGTAFANAVGYHEGQPLLARKIYSVSRNHTVKARYIKACLYSRYHIGMDEIQIYGSDKEIADNFVPSSNRADRLEYTNVLAGKAVYKDGAVQSLLTDELYTDSTAYTDSTVVLTGDLGQQYDELCGYNIYFKTKPKNIRMYLSYDNVNWNLVSDRAEYYTLAGYTNAKAYFNYKEGRYFKFEIDRDASSGNIAVAEIQIFNKQPHIPLMSGGFFAVYPEEATGYNINILSPNTEKMTEYDWEMQLRGLYNLGQETIVLGPNVYRDVKKSVMPIPEGSNLYNMGYRQRERMVTKDLFETILTIADKLGMKVYLGTIATYSYPNIQGTTGQTPVEHYTLTAQDGCHVIRRMEYAYGHHSSFEGYYFTDETCDYYLANYNDASAAFRTLYLTQSKEIRLVSPDKKIMIAPAIWRTSNLTASAENIYNLIKPEDGSTKPMVDVVAAQDCLGRLRSLVVPDDIYNEFEKNAQVWANAVRSAGAEFWYDAEIFEPTYKLKRYSELVKSFETEAKTSNKIINFSYERFIPTISGGADSFSRFLTESYRTEYAKRYTSYIDALNIGSFENSYPEEDHSSKFGGNTFLKTNVQPNMDGTIINEQWPAFTPFGSMAANENSRYAMMWDDTYIYFGVKTNDKTYSEHTNNDTFTYAEDFLIVQFGLPGASGEAGVAENTWRIGVAKHNVRGVEAWVKIGGSYVDEGDNVIAKFDDTNPNGRTAIVAVKWSYLGIAPQAGLTFPISLVYCQDLSAWQTLNGNTQSILSGFLNFTTAEEPGYIVNFDGNGGTCDETKIVYRNGTYGKMPTPTRDPYRYGHDFDGWFTEAEGGTRITAETIVNITANQTLYAHWVLQKFKVQFYNMVGTNTNNANLNSFYLDGSEKEVNGITYTYNPSTGIITLNGTATSSVEFFEIPFVFNGENISGYTITDEIKGGSITNGSVFVDISDSKGNNYRHNVGSTGQMWSLLFDEFDVNTLRFGVHMDSGSSAKPVTLNNYQIRITLNNSTVAKPYEPVGMLLYWESSNGGYGELPTVPARTGYTFDGWYSHLNGKETKAENGETLHINGNHNLFTHWIPNTYTVNFDANSGTNISGSTASMSMTYDVAKNLTANGFTKTGHDFTGWNTKADGTGTSYTNEQSVKNLTATNGGTVTLYAQWTARVYTVTFDANGGSGAPEAQSRAYATPALTLSSTVPTREGYTFKEWNTAQNGSGTSYNPGGSYGENKSVTLYAQWTVNNDNVWDGETVTEPKFDEITNTYYIYTASELAWVSQQVKSSTSNNFKDCTLKLMDDIYLGGHNFTPIGGRSNSGASVNNYFSGIFDGQGHKIYDLYIDSTVAYTGLFGYVNGATIQNFGLISPVISGTDKNTDLGVGGVIGRANNANVSNVFLRDPQITGDYRVGGIIGYAFSTGSTVTNCYVQGGTIKSTASTTNSDGSAGGILGCARVKCNISNCYSTAVCTENNAAADYTGAIVGYFAVAGTTISNSYGENDDDLYVTTNYPPNITDSSAIVKADTLKTYASTLGEAYTNDVANINAGYPIFVWEESEYSLRKLYNQELDSYRNEEKYPDIVEMIIEGLTAEGKLEYWVEYLTAMESAKAILDSEILEDTVVVQPAYDKLEQTIENLIDVCRETDSIIFPWDGVTITAPEKDGTKYYIYTAEELAWVAYRVAQTDDYSFGGEELYLMKNINLGDKEWLPIGGYRGNNYNGGDQFKGTFDGQGHIVSNYKITESRLVAGLFGYTNGATIKELGVEKFEISHDALAQQDQYGTGALVGYVVGTTTVDACFARDGLVSATRSYYVGGLVGNSYTSILTVSNCYVQDVTVENKYANTGSTEPTAGGIVGHINNKSAEIKNCYVAATVSNANSNNELGAVAGYLAANQTIDKCYAANDIDGNKATQLVGTASHDDVILKSMFTSGMMESADLKKASGKLGDSFLCSLNEEYNNGFPILYWEDPEYALNKVYKEELLSERTLYADILEERCPEEYQKYKEAMADAKAESINGEVADKAVLENVVSALNEAIENLKNVYGILEEAVIPWDGTVSEPLSEKSETNTNGKVYYIYTAEELAWMAVHSTLATSASNRFTNDTIKLMKNIDLGGKEWFPIGGYGFKKSNDSWEFESNGSYPFKGLFEGQGHIVSNYKITASWDRAGLFGYTSEATIKELGVENFEITNGISNTSTIYGTGALIGNAGASTVDACFARDGSVSATASYCVGGLVGTSGSTTSLNISNCYVQNVTLENSNSKTVSIGGIIGYIYTSATNAKLTNCYAVVKCTSSNTSASLGAIIGDFGKGTVTNCFAANDVAGNAATKLIGSGNGTTPSSEMLSSGKLKNTVTDPKIIADVFVTNDNPDYNNAYPVLYWENVPENIPVWDGVTTKEPENDGTNYYIYTPEELAWLSQQVLAKPTTASFTGCKFYLMNDIDLNGSENEDGTYNNEWTPIGGRTAAGERDNHCYFDGTFEGQGHIIKNMYITESRDNVNVGLFGCIPATVKINELGIVNANIKTTGQIDYTEAGIGVGILAGYANGSTITNCFVRDSKLSSEKTLNIGGLVGTSHAGAVKISNCYVQNVTIESLWSKNVNTAVGGIIGYTNSPNAQITNCYTAATLTSGNTEDKYLGAIVGRLAVAHTVENCYSVKDIEGSEANQLIGAGSASINATGAMFDTSDELKSATTVESLGNAFLVDTDFNINNGFPLLYWEEPKGDIPAWDGVTTIEPENDGTNYYIYTPEELAWIAKTVNSGNNLSGKTVILMNDINLGNHNWIPIGGIGTTEKYFSGVFNGNYNKIYGLKIVSDTYGIGLFGHVQGTSNSYAEVKNLGIIEPDIVVNQSGNANTGIGALTGRIGYATVNNCFVRGGSVTATFVAGGLVGSSMGAPSIVENCYVQGTEVETTAASRPEESTKCFPTAGGIVGYINDSMTIKNCYSTAVTTATYEAIGEGRTGGIVGYGYTGNEKTITIINSYTANDPLHGAEGKQPIIPDGSAQIDPEELKDYVSVLGDAYIDDDELLGNNGYPRLVWELKEVWDGVTATKPEYDAATSTYYIYTAAELAWIAQRVNATNSTTFRGYTFKLMNDIDLGNHNWTPIGGRDINGKINTDKYFAGTFDGQGHLIRNLKIYNDQTLTGLFGYIYGTSETPAVVKNIGIIKPDVTSECEVDNNGIGSLIGSARNSLVDNCFVRGGSVTGVTRIGGLIGATISAENTNQIINCYAQGVTVTSTGKGTNSSVGGLIGYNNAKSTTIENCYAVANTTADRGPGYEGGILGDASSVVTTIINSYCENDVLYGSALTTKPNLEGGSAQIDSEELKGYASVLGDAYIDDNALLGNNGYPILIWEREYIVSYDANGGTGAPSLQVKKIDVALTLSTVEPTQTGYTFIGWATSSNGEVEYQPGDSYTANESVTLYAQWTANAYTVTFDANGGECDTENITVTYDGTYGELPTPTRTGYEFAGWYTQASGGTQITDATTVSITSDHTLYAHWTANTYTVTFNANGGSGAPSSQTKTHGTALTLSSTKPTRTGYTFKEWNTAQNGTGTSYAAGASYTANAAVTLYAQWTVNTYTVTFDAKGGSTPNPTSKSVTYGGTYGTLPTPTRTGYVFAGWYTSATGGTQVTATTKVATASNHTLYAQWSSDNKYFVLFDTNDGNNVNLFALEKTTKTVNGITYTYDPATGIITLNGTGTAPASMNHYTFSTLPFTVASGDEYTVSLDYLSGSVNNGYLVLNLYDSSTTLWFDMGNNDTKKTWTIPAASASTVNRIELWGWRKDGLSAGESLTFNNYKVKVKIEKSSSKTAYTPTGMYVTYGSAYGTLPTPTRTGYTFNGWWTAASGGTQITEKSTLSVKANQTLYAHWTPNKYKVSFNANDGNNVNLLALEKTTKTVNGITYSYDPSTGIITLNGTGTAPASMTHYTFSSLPFTVASGDEYTFSLDYLSGSVNNGYLVLNLYDSTTNLWFDMGNNDTKKSLSIPAASANTVNRIELWGWYNANKGPALTFNNYKVKVKIEKSSSKTAYTPTGMYATYDSTYGTLPTPTRTGYTFNGWWTAASGGTQVTASTTVSTTAAQTLYAHWTANTYTVTFDAKGGTTPDPTSKSVTYDGTYGTLPTVTRAGYVFAGWYTAAIGGTQVTATTKVATASNHTLYAQWSFDNKYLVSFDTNDGNNVNLFALEERTKTVNGITYSYDAKTGIITLNGSTTDTNTIFYDIPFNFDATNIYEYKIADEVVGGEVTNGLLVIEVRNSVGNPSYRSVGSFYKWEWTDVGANFEPNTLRLWAKCNGGGTPVVFNNYQVRLKIEKAATSTEYTPAGIYAKYGNAYGELPTLERKGYIFDGWYTEAEGGTKVTSDTLISIAGNHTLYAHWSRFKYNLSATSVGSYMTVSLNGETAVVGDIYQTKISEGTEITLNAIVNDGETRDFMFWVDDRGRIVSYTPEYTFILEADKEIEAVYSEDINSEFYTVAFVDSILKTVLDIQQVKKGEAAKIPTTVAENAGYVFDHWDTDTSAVNGNLTVNAVYRPLNKMFTITTAIGTTVKEAKYYYNTKVRIEITDSQIPDGKYFGGWLIDGSDTIASYDEVFEFYAYKDMTVTAVFADKEVEATATVTLASSVFDVNTTEGTYKASLMVTRELPENLVLVSSGLLLTQTAEYGTEDKLTFEEQSANSDTIRLYRTVHTTNDGQYQLTVKTSTSKTFYARGFVVYLDTKTGDIITLYTDVQQVNSNS